MNNPNEPDYLAYQTPQPRERVSPVVVVLVVIGAIGLGMFGLYFGTFAPKQSPVPSSVTTPATPAPPPTSAPAAGQ